MSDEPMLAIKQAQLALGAVSLSDIALQGGLPNDRVAMALVQAALTIRAKDKGPAVAGQWLRLVGQLAELQVGRSPVP